MVFAHGARSGRGITLVRTTFNHTMWINHVVDSFVVVFIQYAQRLGRLATGRRRTCIHANGPVIVACELIEAVHLF